MKYGDLYKVFKEGIPEGLKFFEKKEKENLIDEIDGIHLIFGMVILLYILYVIQKKNV